MDTTEEKALVRQALKDLLTGEILSDSTIYSLADIDLISERDLVGNAGYTF